MSHLGDKTRLEVRGHNSTEKKLRIARRRGFDMANKGHLEVLKRGVSAWNKWRIANPTVLPDLTKADLVGVNLAWANLAGANLAGANLVWAVLAWADLTGANLAETRLAGTDLAGANLLGVNLGDNKIPSAPPLRVVTKYTRCLASSGATSYA
jgi:uncharacterized protein YjbI with pentapeptide repeats